MRKPSRAEIDAENRNRVRRDDARAAQQRSVAAEREQRVERATGRRAAGRRRRSCSSSSYAQLESERRRELAERSQHRRETAVAAVPDDAEADHPAIASLSCSARTRSAIPAASSPHAASCRARGAA